MRRADRRQFHYIYKTTCILTGKFYVGMHSTDDMNDGYMGSGLRITRSLKKYGLQNHTKEILFSLQNRQELREKEKELIPSFQKDPLCMNLAKGGEGGWEFVNENKLSPALRMDEKAKELFKRTGKIWGEAGKINGWKNLIPGSLGRKNSEETRKKMSRSHAGNKNSQHGTRWIFNQEKSIKCNKEDLQKFLDEGWQKGRKMHR